MVGTDAIKNAFIYDTETLSLEGFTVLDDVDPFNRNTRPAIAARFVEEASDEAFVAIINHFKSKGSGDGANADQGDGQGASNPDRMLAAEELLDWTEEDTFFADDERLLLLGDFNAYAQEDPIDILKAGGYVDLQDQFQEGVREPFSYVFNGGEGRLDYALANSELEDAVTGTQAWHINSQEPRGKDYTSFNQAALYQADEFRSSDHDPVLVGLTLAAAEPTPTPTPDPTDSGTATPTPDPDDDGDVDAGGGGLLPTTGGMPLLLALLGLALVGGGGLLVVLARKRRALGEPTG